MTVQPYVCTSFRICIYCNGENFCVKCINIVETTQCIFHHVVVFFLHISLGSIKKGTSEAFTEKETTMSNGGAGSPFPRINGN